LALRSFEQPAIRVFHQPARAQELPSAAKGRAAEALENQSVQFHARQKAPLRFSQWEAGTVVGYDPGVARLCSGIASAFGSGAGSILWPWPTIPERKLKAHAPQTSAESGTCSAQLGHFFDVGTRFRSTILRYFLRTILARREMKTDAIAEK
jgi:hypothetical protein